MTGDQEYVAVQLLQKFQSFKQNDSRGVHNVDKVMDTEPWHICETCRARSACRDQKRLWDLAESYYPYRMQRLVVFLDQNVPDMACLSFPLAVKTMSDRRHVWDEPGNRNDRDLDDEERREKEPVTDKKNIEA